MSKFLSPLLAFALALPCATSPGFAADSFSRIDLRKVHVQGEIGRRIDITSRNNFLVLNADSEFLKPFLDRKGIPGGYVGLGKLIDSAVLLAVDTSDPAVLDRKNHLIDTVTAHQEPGGYLGLFPPDQRLVTLWDVHEVQYIIWGLLQDYRYFGSSRSLNAARQAADHLIEHWSQIPPGWSQQTGVAPHVAVTGLERTFIALHQITQEDKYLQFLLKQRALDQWNLPIVTGRRPGIEGHIYAYLARSLAQLELQPFLPSANGPADGRETCASRALNFLTHQDGQMITGACGQWEIWTNDQDGRGELGETCATAYLLRLYDAMLRRQGDSGAVWGDLMERTIHNALFAAQSPDGRKIRYFVPTEGPRVYHPTDTYCCPCNYRRIVAELPSFVYYQTSDGVAVNLFTPSQAEFPAGDGSRVQIRQETGYPASGEVVIALDPVKEASFTLSVRRPRWASTVALTLPDGSQEILRDTPNGFAHIKRLWKPGDRVRIEFPLEFRLVKGRQRQAGRVAVMRGPLVFCLDPSQQAALAKLDGADLGRITLNPATLQAVEDSSIRPGGIAARVAAWKPSFSLAEKSDFELLLREFPDPEGKQTYFRLRENLGTGDELLHSH